jgi:hypothetical protein
MKIQLTVQHNTEIFYEKQNLTNVAIKVDTISLTSKRNNISFLNAEVHTIFKEPLLYSNSIHL